VDWHVEQNGIFGEDVATVRRDLVAVVLPADAAHP
jgi:hypothetical protein